MSHFEGEVKDFHCAGMFGRLFSDIPGRQNFVIPRKNDKAEFRVENNPLTCANLRGFRVVLRNVRSGLVPVGAATRKRA